MNQFTLRIALQSDVHEIYNAMKKVHSKLDNKSIFVCDNFDFVKNHIDKSGFIVIASDSSKKTAGCLIVRYPENKEDNLGNDIGLSDAEKLQVAHMESAVVLPEYRGNNLQSQMMKYAENNIDSLKYKYILSTVSPENKYSRANLIKCGYSFVLNKVKYDGLSRDIYIKILS